MLRKTVLLSIILAMAISMVANSSGQKWSDMREPTGSPLSAVPPAERSEAYSDEAINVLFVVADDASAWDSIYNGFCGLPEAGTCVRFDSSGDTPSVRLLMGFAVVIVWANFTHADPNALGNNLADYIDADGKVIASTPTRSPDYSIGGRFLSGGYDPLVYAPGIPLGPANLGDSTGHAIMKKPYGINILWGDLREATTLHPSADLVASWDDDANLVATKGSVVGMTGFLHNGYWDGQFPQLLVNACSWLVGGNGWPTHVYDKVFNRMGAMAAVPVLRDYRDEVLVMNSKGKDLVEELYAARCAELAKILLTNSGIRQSAGLMIMRNLAGIQKIVDGGQIEMTPLELVAVRDLLNDVSKVASPDFGAYVESVQKVLQSEKDLADLGVRVAGRRRQAPGLRSDSLTTTWSEIKGTY